MKKITLTIAALLTGLSLFAQAYNLDETFGNNGVKFNSGVSFRPLDVLFADSNYYFISSTKIGKVNYNGDINTAFGTNGFMLITYDNKECTISGFKYIDGSFYVYGTIQDTTENYNGFVCKITSTGTLDTTFGTGGFSIVDFSATKEVINDITVDQNGDLFCIGGARINNVGVLTYFKLDNATGALNSGFDANGYKQLTLNSNNSGSFIFNYGANFLLVGMDNYYVAGSSSQQNLFISLVDTNGSLVTSYGTNGQTNTVVTNGESINLEDVQLIDNNLYVNYFHSFSFINMGSGLLKFDLNTNSLVFTDYNFRTYYDMQIADGAIYTTGSDRCQPATVGSCENNMDVTKLLLNGEEDPNDTSFTYDFSHENSDMINYSDDRASVIFKDESGKILIAGTSNRTGIGFGFALVRVEAGPLSLNDVSTKTASIYPNPFNDFITVESGSQIKDVQVIDVSGRVISTPNFTMEGETARVNLETLQQSGMYLMQVTTIDNKTFTRKIVKQ